MSRVEFELFKFVSELKDHPFFEGIDWAKVANRQCNAPYEPNEIEINQLAPLNLTELFKSDVDDDDDMEELEPTQAKQFKSEHVILND